MLELLYMGKQSCPLVAVKDVKDLSNSPAIEQAAVILSV
jgi:hypothetical protein